MVPGPGLALGSEPSARAAARRRRHPVRHRRERLPRDRPRALRGGVRRGLRRVGPHPPRRRGRRAVARVRGRRRRRAGAPRPAGAPGRGERPARALPRAPRAGGAGGGAARGPALGRRRLAHVAGRRRPCWRTLPCSWWPPRGRRCWRAVRTGARACVITPASRWNRCRAGRAGCCWSSCCSTSRRCRARWSTSWSTAPRATRSTSRSSSPGSSTPVSSSAATVRGTCGWTASTRSACRPRSRGCCRPGSTASRGPNALCCNARR